MHFTPLLAAIRYAQPQTVQVLLRKDANLLAKDRLKHYNAILWAVEIQNLDILKVLIAIMYHSCILSCVFLHTQRINVSHVLRCC